MLLFLLLRLYCSVGFHVSLVPPGEQVLIVQLLGAMSHSFLAADYFRKRSLEIIVLAGAPVSGLWGAAQRLVYEWFGPGFVRTRRCGRHCASSSVLSGGSEENAAGPGICFPVFQAESNERSPALAPSVEAIVIYKLTPLVRAISSEGGSRQSTSHFNFSATTPPLLLVVVIMCTAFSTIVPSAAVLLVIHSYKAFFIVMRIFQHGIGSLCWLK